MTEAEIIDDVIARERGFADHPNDRGGPTKYGITASTLGQWRQMGRPATRDEVRALELSEAQAIYRHLYIEAPGFDAITAAPLRAQVIDYGVLSGSYAATVALQRALEVEADGVFGKRTRAALLAADPVMVHVRVLKHRLRRFAQIVEADHSQAVFLEGWTMRALTFLADDGRPRA